MNGDRELARAITAPRGRLVYRLCVYCGDPCRGPACAQHRDLLALEPERLAHAARPHDQAAAEARA